MNMNILKLPTAVPLIEAVSDSETVSDEVVSCPTKKYCTTMYNISLLWRGKMFTAKTEESAHPHLNLVPQRGQEEFSSTFSGLLFILISLLCLALRTIYRFIIYHLHTEKWVATSFLTCNIELIEFLFVAVAPRGIADCRSYFNRSSLHCSCCTKTTSVLQ